MALLWDAFPPSIQGNRTNADIAVRSYIDIHLSICRSIYLSLYVSISHMYGTLLGRLPALDTGEPHLVRSYIDIHLCVCLALYLSIPIYVSISHMYGSTLGRLPALDTGEPHQRGHGGEKLSVYPSICRSGYLSVHPSMDLSHSLSLSLSLYIYIYIYI